MRNTRSRLGGVALVAGLSVVLAACGGSSGGSKSTTGSSQASSGRVSGDPMTVNTATVKKGGKLTYTLEKNITDWNISTSEGNTFETAEVMDAIAPQLFVDQPDLSTISLNTDLATSATQTKSSPQTIVIKINPKATWSDGTPITADDFIYFWHTQNGKDCPKCDVASTVGWDQIQSVTGSDNGKTVTVVFSKPFGDWKSLWGNGYGIYPSHLVKGMSLEQGWNTFFAKPPTWSGGPYLMKTWQDNTAATLVANPKWYGAKGPYLDTLIFRVITDATQEPAALQNREVDAIYPQPEVDLLKQIEQIPNVKYQLDLGLNYEHFDLNLKNPFLQDVAVRQAMFTAVNTKDIIAKTVGQFDSDVKPDGNRWLVNNQQGYQDNVTSFGYGTGDITKAKKILTDAGYKIQNGKLITPQGKTFPALRLRYTVGNAIRETECNLFKAQVAQLGIPVNVESTDSLGGSLTHKDPQHDYDVIVFAWVGNPFFVSSTVPNFITGGGNNFGAYSNKQADAMMNQAMAESDRTKQVQMVNQIDQMISKDAYTLPLYQKPTFLAYYNNIGNLRDNATGTGPPYNVQEWGFK